MYASFLRISEALHLGIFHQPLKIRFFDSFVISSERLSAIVQRSLCASQEQTRFSTNRHLSRVPIPSKKQHKEIAPEGQG